MKDWEVHEWIFFFWASALQAGGLWFIWWHNIVLGILLTLAAWGLSWQQRQ